MKFRVVIQPRAERDIWSAARWIEEQSGSPAKALRWGRRLRAKVDTLKADPQRWPVGPDPDAHGEIEWYHSPRVIYEHRTQ